MSIFSDRQNKKMSYVYFVANIFDARHFFMIFLQFSVFIYLFIYSFVTYQLCFKT